METAKSRERLFSDRKLGMFIHWGLYTILGRGEWVLYIEKMPPAEYEALNQQFTGDCFDAEHMALLAVECGMKYIVFTTKHHDGFCLFDSALTSYSTAGTGVKRDYARELSLACKKHGIGFHPYYSLWDWHHPDFVPDDPVRWRKYLSYYFDQVRELCTNYGQLSGMWFDCGGGPRLEKYELQELGKMIHSLQPEAAVMCVDYWVGERSCMPDKNGRPKLSGLASETLCPGIFEVCETVNDHYCFCPEDKNFKSPTYLRQYFLELVGHGGNFLLNIGPKADGSLDEDSVACLRSLGEFSNRYAEALYGSQPGHPNINPCGYTLTRDDHVYFFITEFTEFLDGLSNSSDPLKCSDGEATIAFNGIKTPVESVCFVGGESISFKQNGSRLSAIIPRRLLTWPCVVLDAKTKGTAEVEGNIHPDANGNFNLTSEWAGIFTPRPCFPRYYPGDDGGHVGYWTQVDGRVEWILDIPKPASFEVQIEQACYWKEAGSSYEIRFEKPSFVNDSTIIDHETGELLAQQKTPGAWSHSLSATTQPTSSWNAYAQIPVGRVELPAGLVKVELKPTKLKGGAFLDLKRMRLTIAK